MVSNHVNGKKRADPDVRRLKAEKIISVLKSQLGDRMEELTCLDVGCSVGIISNALASHFRAVVGLDVDEKALSEACRQKTLNLSILMADGTRLPFREGYFDVVVCAQVYEHSSDAGKLFCEIHRVLKNEGVCFFSGPNKLSPVEMHYSLPFIHWLPKRVADSLVKALGRGDSYAEKPLFYWELVGLLSQFEIIDYTTKIIRDPSSYSCDTEVKPYFLSYMPECFLRKVPMIFPNYNWILKKKAKSK
jgi:SAM-dependent methyltransferase